MQNKPTEYPNLDAENANIVWFTNLSGLKKTCPDMQVQFYKLEILL